VTFSNGSGIVQESSTAVTAQSAFVHMPLFQHGSGKAIEHC
jgi:hypothetical protein